MDKHIYIYIYAYILCLNIVYIYILYPIHEHNIVSGCKQNNSVE